MNAKWVCCKCRKPYDWYGEVYEESDDQGTFRELNCFIFYKAHPSPSKPNWTQDLDNADGNLDNEIINLCQDCMRDLMKNICPYSGQTNCFDC